VSIIVTNNPKKYTEILTSGVKAWNEWRKNNRDECPVFYNEDLKGLNLSGADLSDADLLDANLYKTDLSFSDLSRADLRNANLSKANFHSSDFTHAELTGAIIHMANFNKTTGLPEWIKKGLVDGKFYQNELINAIKRGFKNLVGATLIGADLSETDLTNTNFENAVLKNVNFNQTDLSNVNFFCSQITLNRLTNLKNGIFTNTKGTNTNYSWANITVVNSNDSGLSGIKLHMLMNESNNNTCDYIYKTNTSNSNNKKLNTEKLDIMMTEKSPKNYHLLPYKFFICYAKEDYSVAKRVLDSLLTNEELIAWIDESSLLEMPQFKNQILYALEENIFIIFVFSNNYNNYYDDITFALNLNLSYSINLFELIFVTNDSFNSEHEIFHKYQIIKLYKDWNKGIESILDCINSLVKRKKDERFFYESDYDPTSIESLLTCYMMGIELGYGLTPLADKVQKGELLNHVQTIREEVFHELGLLLPPIHFIDNLKLKTYEYRIIIRGNEFGKYELMGNDHFLAIPKQKCHLKLEGLETTVPGTEKPAIWIPVKQVEKAELSGYYVLDPSHVFKEHLKSIIYNNLDEFLDLQHVQILLDLFEQLTQKSIKELNPNLLTIGDLKIILQNLLKEKISIKEMKTIAKTLLKHLVQTKDLYELTELVRQALLPQILKAHLDANGDLPVMTLYQHLEYTLLKNIKNNEQGSYLNIKPDLLKNIIEQIKNVIDKEMAEGKQLIVIYTPQLRRPFSNLIRQSFPLLMVISKYELKANISLKLLGKIGFKPLYKYRFGV